jgi:hypothetical protein
MSQIKKLMDRIVAAENRNAKDVVLLLSDARELRDEVMKILLDKNNNQSDVIEVVVKGGKFK